MSLNILYSFPHRIGVTGIGNTAWHQVQGLIDLGFHVTLYCGSVERPLRGAVRIVETMQFGPIPLSYRAIGLDRAMGWHDWCVASALKRDATRVDVVHCWPSGALRTLRAAKELGIAGMLERPSSHTLDVYEAARTECSKLGVELRRGQYAKLNEPRLAKEELEFKSAKYLLCPSEAAARSFLNRGYGIESIRVHQYGFDPDVFSPDAGSHRGADPHAIHALYVGLCFPLKGLHIALKAWCTSAASRSGTFIICGEFVDGYREVLSDLLLHPSVRVLGYRKDIAEIMRNSNVLIHPSLSEGSALVTYEAQACGLVPVVSDAAGAKCTHMVDSLIHRAGDVHMLRQHLDLLARTPELLGTLQAGVDAHVPSLTWSAAAKRLAEVYTEAFSVRTAGAIQHDHTANADVCIEQV